MYYFQKKDLAGNLNIRKGTDANIPRFDKQLEEFYSICDQIEVHLQSLINCSTQASSSHKYVPNPVTQIRQDAVMNQETLNYQNYVTLVRNQVAYLKDVSDMLADVANNVSGD